MADQPASRVCATMEHHKYLAETDETYQVNRRQVESRATAARFSPRSEIIRIPTVVHVVYYDEPQNVSQSQIDSQIERLNLDFRLRNKDQSTIPKVFRGFAADPLIEFALAVRDPSGQPTTGVTRTRTSKPQFPYKFNDHYATAKLDLMIKHDEFGKAAWPRDDYLNMWVCAIQDGLLGYAQLPGGPASTDGAVMNHSAFGSSGTAQAPFDLGRTAVHEVGHWLNLLHIWGEDGTKCTDSDNIADTPNQAGPNYKQPQFPRVTCNNGPNGDMFMNYMDYVDDAAMVMFTKGQVDRMNAALTGPRASLARSKGLLPVVTEPLVLTPDSTAAAPVGAEAGEQIARRFDGVTWVDV